MQKHSRFKQKKIVLIVPESVFRGTLQYSCLAYWYVRTYTIKKPLNRLHASVINSFSLKSKRFVSGHNMEELKIDKMIARKFSFPSLKTDAGIATVYA